MWNFTKKCLNWERSQNNCKKCANTQIILIIKKSQNNNYKDNNN